MQKKEAQEQLEEIMQENLELATNAEAEKVSEAVDGTAPQTSDERDQKIEELQKRILRLQADFDNFRRRTAREHTELAAFVTAGVVEKFLKVLDSFNRAEESVAKATDLESIRVGVEMIKGQLDQTLKELAVEEIPAQGQKFNPELHEAIMRGENQELEDDTIELVFEKGYKLNEKVIRHSKVKVINNN